MKIGIANDHRAFETKEQLKKLLNDYEITDYGCYSNERTDYPIYALKLAEAVKNKEVDLGIVMCGTGIGVSIACNKVKNIRCAKINNLDEAKSAKEHNNANILAFGADFNNVNQIKDMISVFINSKFKTDECYSRRIHEVEEYEDNNEY